MRVIFLICFLFSQIAQAIEIGDWYFKEVLSAKTTEKIKFIEEQYFQFQVEKRACRLQLRNLKLPTRCFSYYKILNELTAYDSQSPIGFSELVAVCEKRSKTVQSLDAREIQLLPAKCASLASKSSELFKYKFGM